MICARPSARSGRGAIGVARARWGGLGRLVRASGPVRVASFAIASAVGFCKPPAEGPSPAQAGGRARLPTRTTSSRTYPQAAEMS
eukprot:15453759-Alexandrium_andersonii.AAC.1